MPDIEIKVLKLVDDGVNLDEMPDLLGCNRQKILEIRKKLREQGKLTKERIKAGKNRKKLERYKQDPTVQKILKYKRRGMSNNEISKLEDVGRVLSNINCIVKECIEFGLITQKEIEKAYNKRKKKEKEIKKAREKAKNNKQNDEKNVVHIEKEKLLSYLILGYNIFDIIHRLGKIDIDEYNKLKQELINEGKITNEEIIEYQEKKKEEDKEKVLNCLKDGISHRKIAKIIDMTLVRVENYITKIKEEQNISDEEIKSWKEEQEDSPSKRRRVVLSGLVEGLTCIEIAQRYPKQKLTINNVKNYSRILISEGRITPDDIIRYRNLRKEREQKQKEDNRSEELTDFEKQVIIYSKDGYRVQKIAELTQTAKSTVLDTRSRLYKLGKMTKEEVEEAKNRREENELLDIEKEVLKRLKDGYENKEIIESSDKSANYIRYIMRKLKEKRLITEKEIKEARENRKRRELKKTLICLKRKLNNIVILKRELKEEEKTECKNYINLSYDFYKDGNISILELEFLENTLRRIQIDFETLSKFGKLCVSAEEYRRLLIIVRSKETLQFDLSKKEETKLEELENSLVKSCRIQQAKRMIGKGNTDIKAIKEATMLSSDEINILKINLSKKPFKILNIVGREKLIDQILKSKNMVDTYKERNISDLEAQDIEEQALYRRIDPEKRDLEQEIKRG